MVFGGGVVHFCSCLRVQLSSSLCNAIDELIVENARTKETQSTFSIPVPSPSTSYMPTFSQKQQDMMQAFSAQSGTNLQGLSSECLESLGIGGSLEE